MFFSCTPSHFCNQEGAGFPWKVCWENTFVAVVDVSLPGCDGVSGPRGAGGAGAALL